MSRSKGVDISIPWDEVMYGIGVSLCVSPPTHPASEQVHCGINRSSSNNTCNIEWRWFCGSKGGGGQMGLRRMAPKGASGGGGGGAPKRA